MFQNIDPAWPRFGQTNCDCVDCVPSGKEDRGYLPEELIIGGVPVKVRTGVSHTPNNDSMTSYGLAGTLVPNVFGGYWCEISFSTQKIILHQQKPTGYTRSIRGYFLIESILLVEGSIDGTDYGFVITSNTTGDPTDLSAPIIFPSNVAEKQPGNEYIQFAAKDGTHYWTRIGNLQILGDVFTGVIGGTSPWLTDVMGKLDPPEVLGRPITAGNTGALTWDFLRNYDLLFDFTGLSFNKDAFNNHPETSVWYTARGRVEDREAVFPREYPGGELGAFVYCTPAGADLFLTKDSPLRSLGITEETVITRINGVQAEHLAVESGDNIVLNLDYQTELTVLGTDKQEQVIALSQEFVGLAP
jgi:hypothetical protein